jgi:hypothetical protein
MAKQLTIVGYSTSKEQPAPEGKDKGKTRVKRYDGAVCTKAEYATTYVNEVDRLLAERDKTNTREAHATLKDETVSVHRMAYSFGMPLVNSNEEAMRLAGIRVGGKLQDEAAGETTRVERLTILEKTWEASKFTFEDIEFKTALADKILANGKSRMALEAVEPWLKLELGLTKKPKPVIAQEVTEYDEELDLDD